MHNTSQRWKALDKPGIDFGDVVFLREALHQDKQGRLLLWATTKYINVFSSNYSSYFMKYYQYQVNHLLMRVYGVLLDTVGLHELLSCRND